jgi:hypothetical protein
MKKVIALMTVALSLLVIGCSEQKPIAPSTPPSTQEQTNIDAQRVLDESGATDWSQPEAAPAFQTQVDSVDTSFDVYLATFIWGQFSSGMDSTATVTDWSGTLNLNAVGGIRVRSVFRFEPGQDSLLPPPDSATIAWTSQTLRDYDGLHIMILVKRGIVYVTEPRLRFATTPFSLDIPLSGLTRFNAFYRVDNHNGIVVFARQVPRLHCPRGNILGVWHRDSTWQNGPFEGFWLPGNMPPMPPLPPNLPKVYGKFFTTDDNQHLFAGKYTDTTGAEVGELYGTWFYDDPTMCMMCGSGHAQFKGRFTINGRGEVGDVWGEIGIAPGGWTTPKMNMPIRGVWRIDCVDMGEESNRSVM